MGVVAQGEKEWTRARHVARAGVSHGSLITSAASMRMQ